MWEERKPKIVLTDNKSVKRFFQTKAIPPALWNACDYVLQFNFQLAYVAGSINTAADFLSRLELKVTEKIRLKIREDIQKTPIEVVTTSSDVADEEQFVFFPRQTMRVSQMDKSPMEKQSRQKAMEWVADKEPSREITSVKEFTKIDGDATSHSMTGIKVKAQIRVEQNVDLVVKNLEMKIFGQCNDEALLTRNKRYKH